MTHKRWQVRSLPQGCRLTVCLLSAYLSIPTDEFFPHQGLFDVSLCKARNTCITLTPSQSCHSGTALGTLSTMYTGTPTDRLRRLTVRRELFCSLYAILGF